MTKRHVLPLVLVFAVLGGCDLFDDDDDDDDNDRREPVAMTTSFSSLFDDAFTRDANGDPVMVNDLEIDDDASDTNFDSYLAD